MVIDSSHGIATIAATFVSERDQYGLKLSEVKNGQENWSG
jgi:hypothetical protein